MSAPRSRPVLLCAFEDDGKLWLCAASHPRFADFARALAACYPPSIVRFCDAIGHGDLDNKEAVFVEDVRDVVSD